MNIPEAEVNPAETNAVVNVPAVTAVSNFVVTAVKVIVASALIVYTTFTPELLLTTALFPALGVVVISDSSRASCPIDSKVFSEPLFFDISTKRGVIDTSSRRELAETLVMVIEEALRPRESATVALKEFWKVVVCAVATLTPAIP
jgi:hypothetical protein